MLLICKCFENWLLPCSKCCLLQHFLVSWVSQTAAVEFGVRQDSSLFSGLHVPCLAFVLISGPTCCKTLAFPSSRGGVTSVFLHSLNFFGLSGSRKSGYCQAAHARTIWNLEHVAVCLWLEVFRALVFLFRITAVLGFDAKQPDEFQGFGCKLCKL